MKKILLVLFLILSNFTFAQNTKFNIYPNLAVDLGGAIPFPLSDIPDGAGGTPKPYPSMGLGAQYNIYNKWQVALEINYHLIAFSADAEVVSQAFYYDNGTPMYYSGNTETDVELRMIEFPLLAFYEVNKGKRFLFGFYYSRILEGRFETKGINGIYSPDKNITDNATLPGPNYTLTYNFNDNIDKYDYGILVGYRYDINHRFYLWSRLNIGFKSIFEKEFDNIDYEMYQVRINLGVSFKILS